MTNDRPYAVTVYEKYKDVDGLTVLHEVGVVPAKQTKDFGRVINGGDKQGRHTFELRNAQDKVIDQLTAVEDEETHDVVNLHINR